MASAYPLQRREVRPRSGINHPARRPPHCRSRCWRSSSSAQSSRRSTWHVAHAIARPWSASRRPSHPAPPPLSSSRHVPGGFRSGSSPTGNGSLVAAGAGPSTRTFSWLVTAAPRAVVVGQERRDVADEAIRGGCRELESGSLDPGNCRRDDSGPVRLQVVRDIRRTSHVRTRLIYAPHLETALAVTAKELLLQRAPQRGAGRVALRAAENDGAGDGWGDLVGVLFGGVGAHELDGLGVRRGLCGSWRWPSWQPVGRTAGTSGPACRTAERTPARWRCRRPGTSPRPGPGWPSSP